MICYTPTSFDNFGKQMLIGYARVSTADQNLDLQVDALRQHGCERIFSDRTSGARADRPAMREALEFARPGDALVVWKLDRLSRSLGQPSTGAPFGLSTVLHRDPPDA